MRQMCFNFEDRKKRGLSKYTQEEIDMWVRDFRTGASYREVAAVHSVPYATVAWHVKKALGGPSGRPVGRRPVTGEDEATVTRRRNLKIYGLTLEEYDVMFAAQGGACAICKKPVEGNLHVDHDHVTGKPRGLLCNNHNTGLGKFQDSPVLLRAAASYLEGARG